MDLIEHQELVAVTGRADRYNAAIHCAIVDLEALVSRVSDSDVAEEINNILDDLARTL